MDRTDQQPPGHHGDSQGMSVCPACRTPVASADVFGSHRGRRVEAESGAIVPKADDCSGDWTEFECRDGSFAICHPADWQPADPPVSAGASVSCIGPGGFKLLLPRRGRISSGSSGAC